MNIYDIKNLTYYYPDSIEPTLKNINIKIKKGEIVLFIGLSGSGKSTLFKLMTGICQNFYGGKLEGRIYFNNKDITETNKVISDEVGIVFQEPERQIISTNVERELVFGMENMGFSSELIKKRLAEVSNLLNIGELLDKKTIDISSGQMQKVAIGSIISMNPQVLILDEPTSQLDPISSEEIINFLRKLNEESGKTVIFSEHKLEKVLHFVDKVFVLEKGSLVFEGSNKEFLNFGKTKNILMPVLGKLFFEYDDIPLTIKEAKRLVSAEIKQNCIEKICEKNNEKILEINNLWFSYNNTNEVLKNINFELNKGDFISVIGHIGAGKTTLMKCIIKTLKPRKGKILIKNKNIENITSNEISKLIGYLGQNPDNYLFNETVEKEILFSLKNFALKWSEKTDENLKNLGILELLYKNPRDLSVGQKQRVALSIVLSTEPEIVILDEPTRGMDYKSKEELGQVLLNLKEKGKTIILISHDIDFIAEYTEKILYIHKGEIVAFDEKTKVLKDNIYYIPIVSKLLSNVFTLEDAKKIFTKKYEVYFKESPHI